jgi:hypothetical protein
MTMSVDLFSTTFSNFITEDNPNTPLFALHKQRESDHI